jgi:hypothetical protein
MRYLHERGGNNLPGGIEWMITYSFFAQGHITQSRTMRDLSVLRNTVFPTGLDLQFQIQDNKESAEGLCSQLRSTLKRLKEVNDLPSWDKMVDGGQEMLDKRQEDIDSLLKLYMDQATRDYHTSKLDKERLLLYAHLSQQQSIQVLELHGRLAESMDKSRLLIEKALGDRLEETNEKLDKAIRLIMKQNQDVISNMLVEATKNITEFDVHDMQALMISQKEALQNALDQNAMLAGQNSELRMHLSYMPVEYRGFVANLQKTDNPKYRDQRRNPKVIVPESFHKDGYAIDFTIELEEAPLAHSAVQFCLRDAQYATLGEARRGMERGVKLRDYVQLHVFPKSAPPAKSAPPGLPPPVPDTSSAPQSRTPLDQRLTPTGQAQVASQFTAAGVLNDGFVPPSSSQRSGDKGTSNDGFIPPSPSQRYGDKGKRSSPSPGSRNQPPPKYSKSDTSSYTSSSNSWRDSSFGRSVRPPLARNDRACSKSSIPKPPTPPGQESSSAKRPPPTLAATRGELRYPIPYFDGEHIELFTRDEAKDVYKTVRAKLVTLAGYCVCSTTVPCSTRFFFGCAK